MFSSLAESLGMNGTFFVQFLIFLALYPVLSRLLFRPFFHLHEQREKQTLGRMKKADEWPKEERALKAEYEEKARRIDRRFDEIYLKESKRLKQGFLEDKERKQKALQKDQKQKNREILQEIKQKEHSLFSEAGRLSKTLIHHLLSS